MIEQRKLSLLSALIIMIINFSCKKEIINGNATPVLKIDQIELQNLNKILIKSVVQNIDINNIEQAGFCWSKGMNPTIDSSNKIIKVENATISGLIENLENNTNYSIRAFVKIKNSKSVIYSTEQTFKTGGIKELWDNQNFSKRLRLPIKAIKTKDNKFIIISHILSIYTSAYNVEIIKTNLDGDVEWQNDYAPYPGIGFAYETPVTIEETDHFYYLVTDKFDGYRNYGFRNQVIYKISPDGRLLWKKNLNNEEEEDVIAVSTLSDNSLYITTRTYRLLGANRINMQIHNKTISESSELIKHDSIISSSTNLNTSSPAIYGTHVEGNQNGFLLTCYRGSQLLLQKYDKYGTITNDQLVDYLAPRQISQANSKIAIVGHSYDGGPSIAKVAVTDTSGNILWNFKYSNLLYGSEGLNNFTCIAQNNKGEYLVGGQVTHPQSIKMDPYIVKLTSSGIFHWDYLFKPSLNIYQNSIFSILTVGPDIYVFGYYTWEEKKVSEVTNLYIKKLTQQ